MAQLKSPGIPAPNHCFNSDAASLEQPSLLTYEFPSTSRRALSAVPVKPSR